MNSREIKFRVWDNKYKGWMECQTKYAYSTSGVGKFISALGKHYELQELLDNETLTDEFHKQIPYDGTNPRWVVQQFTGISDYIKKEILDYFRNEIYEGDIVKNYTIDEEYCSPAVVVWAKYDEVSFALAYNPHRIIEPHEQVLKHVINGVELIEEFRLSRLSAYDVIGNIFETPELLK